MIRFFRKASEGGLMPLFENDREWLAKKKVGAQFKVNIKTTRNPDHHRKAFALFNLVASNHPQYSNVEDVLLEMKLRSGHYTEQIRPGNSEVARDLREYIRARLRDTIQRDVILTMVDQLEREAKMAYMPKSISFDAMGQEEFEALYDRWLAIASEMIGVKDETLRQELAEF